MSASRRLQLLAWAEQAGSWVIEDDYDSEYRYESMPIASLQGLDHHARVIYIGTFSKVLFPSLRLGYIVIPADLVEAFLAVRLSMDIGPSHFFQAVLADFIPPSYPLEIELQNLVAVQECTSRDLIPEAYRELKREDITRRVNEIKELMGERG